MALTDQEQQLVDHLLEAIRKIVREEMDRSGIAANKPSAAKAKDV